MRRGPRARVWTVVPLLSFAVLGAISLRLDSATFDETAHVVAGLSYLETGDFRLNTEHPPLVKLWAAWPVRLLGRDATDYRSPAWDAADPWVLGFETLNGARANPTRRDPARILVPARTAMLALGVALGAVVFAWSREMWGREGATLSLVLFALSPTILAHARYVTTDLPAALGIALGLFTFWRFTRRPVLGRAALAGLAAGIAVATKFTCLLLGPMLLVVAVPWVVAAQDARARRDRAKHALLGLALLAAVAAATLWAAYGFRYTASPDPGRVLDWSVLDARPGPAADALRAARDLRVAPEAWLHGLAKARVASSRRVAYLNGETSVVGWWSYFPEAFLLKTPPAILALVLWAAWLGSRRARSISLDVWAALGPLLVYAAVSLVSRLNIGHRHLAPLEPLLLVLLGGLARVAWRTRAGRAALGILLVAGAGSLASATPRYLSYFNALAGGPAGAPRYLLDSNLDWGQDLARLGEWTRANGNPEIFLAYFGTADPRAYGIRYRKVLMVHDFFPEEPPSRPRTGDLLAVSANLLHGLYVDEDAALGRALLVARLVTAAQLEGWIRLRDRESRAGRPHPPLGEWLAAGGLVSADVVNRVREGLLGAWLARLRESTEPLVRIGDSIYLYRVPPSDGGAEPVAGSIQPRK